MHWRRRRRRCIEKKKKQKKQAKQKQSNKALCISILKLGTNLRPHKKKISWPPPCKKKRDCARVVGKNYWRLKIHRRRRIIRIRRIRRFAKQQWRRRRRRLLQKKKKKKPQQIVADPFFLWSQSEWGVLLVFLFLFFWALSLSVFSFFVSGLGFLLWSVEEEQACFASSSCFGRSSEALQGLGIAKRIF